MTSMYIKLCNKQDGCFFLVCHICIQDKNNPMGF
jgi:hypothetical protein